MGWLDNMKARLEPARDKVSDLAQRHEGSIGQGLDRAAKAVDEKTGRRYSEKIHAGTGKAKKAVDRLARPGERRTDTGASTGAGTGASSAPGGGPAPTPPQSPPAGPPPVS